MRELPWRILAAVVSLPAVSGWLVRRAMRTPYTHITSRDGSETYMRRWWLFNAYRKGPNDEVLPGRWEWLGLPSIRVHHILRPDDDEHQHDHPWNARTIVMQNWYMEERPVRRGTFVPWNRAMTLHGAGDVRVLHERRRGYTGRVLFGQYHRIVDMPPEGVVTLWFTWKYQGTWGFLVDGTKVPYRTYLAERGKA